MAAAALLHALVHDHAFHNGNKRTALVSMLVMLDRNGYTMDATEEELFDFVLALGGHGILPAFAEVPSHERSDAEVLEGARWLQRHTRRVEKKERLLKFSALRPILSRHGCTIGTPADNRVTIRRGALQTNVWHGDDGRDVQINTVQKIRKDLELDMEHGYDSRQFYAGADPVDAFIRKYRTTLDRLAKT